MYVLINTRSGAEYLLTHDEGAQTGTLVRNNGTTPLLHLDEGYITRAYTIEDVSVAEVRAAKVGEPLHVTAGGGLLSSSIERILHPLAFAEIDSGAMLPMVTNRCGCGKVVDLAPDLYHRDWEPSRIDGNSENGYEPTCSDCLDRECEGAQARAVLDVVADPTA